MVGVCTVVLVASPFALPAAALADLVTGRRGFGRTRATAFIVSSAANELRSLALLARLWLADGAGRRIGSEPSVRRHEAAQARYTDGVVGPGQRLLGITLDVHGIEHLQSDRPLILVSRHASQADSILPAWLVTCQADRRLRYVLKSELLWAPCLDLAGHRIPTWFVDRNAADRAAERAVGLALAGGMDAGEVAAIFPEGTRFSEPKRARALVRLSEHQPHLVEAAERLVQTLPPRTGGVLTLLEGSPDADVVLLLHTGLPNVSSFGELARNVPLAEPVRLELQPIARGTIPTDRKGRERWLLDLWSEVDAWVAEHASD